MNWTVVFAIVSIPRGMPKCSGHSSYEAHNGFLSTAERFFPGVFEQAAGTHFRVFAKVRVADVLTQRRSLSRGDWQTAFNKISVKHFEFVLCNPKSLGVRAVVEFNDRSHNLSRRARRDDFLRAECAGADGSRIEIAVQSGNSIEQARAALPMIAVEI